MPTKKEKKKNKSNIIFESNIDDITIINISVFWIYVVTSDQWNIIQHNIKNDNMYISSYRQNNVCQNDILIIYLKADNKKLNGFVAIGQIKSDMIKNNDAIKVYDDQNINKYIIELRSISIFSNSCKICEFNDIIVEISKEKIKNTTRFAALFLKGDSMFTELTIPDLGVEIVKKMFELAKNMEETPDLDENKSEITNSDNNNYDGYVIKNNIPIMLTTCNGFKNEITKIKKNKNKIKLVINHYKYCDKCDITNNNKRELCMTLNAIDNSSIEIANEDDDYTELLDAYLIASEFDSNVDTEYIKLYYISGDEIYNQNVLIEYTSKIIHID